MEDMHTMSSANINAMFDGMSNLTAQMQDGYQQTVNAFQQTTAQTQQMSAAPRRSDGFYQQPQMSQSPYGGFGGYQQQPQYQAPPSYGYGYTEQSYNNPYGGMFNNAANNQQPAAYYGFYNPGYGK